MRNFITISFVLSSFFSSAQSSIGSVNSGALSETNLIHSVGEIYVEPVSDINEGNSGLIGVISRIEFFLIGIDDQLLSDDIRVYPNPVSNSLCFETRNEKQIEEIYIYNTEGKLVSSIKPKDSKVDLSSLTNGTYIVKTNISTVNSFTIIKQ